MSLVVASLMVLLAVSPSVLVVALLEAQLPVLSVASCSELVVLVH